MTLRSFLLLFFISASIPAFSQGGSKQDHVLGLTWTTIPVGTTSSLGGLSIASPDTMFMYASTSPAGELRSIDGGFTWSSFPTPNKNTNVVKFLNPLIGYSFGPSYDSSIACRTTDGGENWSAEVNDSLAGYPAGPTITSPDTAFLVSATALILQTTDGCKTWHRTNAVVDASINALTFTDLVHGMAVGATLDSEVCFVTDDGGMNWTQKTVPPATQELVGVTTCGIDTAIAIGNNICRTTDDGNTWTDVTPILGFVVGWHSIASYHQQVLATSENGILIYSSDAGLTWTRQVSGTSDNLYSVAFVNDSVAFVTGDNGTLLRGTGFASSGVASNSPVVSESVSPDPAGNEITFHLALDAPPNIECHIYSTNGVLMQSAMLSSIVTGQEQQYRLSSEMLPNGTYFYDLSSRNFSRTGSFVVSQP